MDCPTVLLDITSSSISGFSGRKIWRASYWLMPCGHDSIQWHKNYNWVLNGLSLSFWLVVVLQTHLACIVFITMCSGPMWCNWSFSFYIIIECCFKPPRWETNLNSPNATTTSLLYNLLMSMVSICLGSFGKYLYYQSTVTMTTVLFLQNGILPFDKENTRRTVMARCFVAQEPSV